MLADPVSFPLAGIGDEAATELNGQLAAIRALGWPSIELRTVDGSAVADLDTPRFSDVLRTVRAEGLDVVCLASRIGSWARPITTPPHVDLRELDVLAERCAALGTRFVRIMSYPNDGLPADEWRDRVLDRIARLARRAAAHDIVLLHENCSGWAGADPDRMLRLITKAGGPALRLLFDTGNGVEHGYDAYALLRRVVPYVAHVHVKDALGGPANTTYVLPGEGRSHVADCLRLLVRSGYSGTLSIEPHLSARPHQGVHADASATSQFIQAGRRLERLLRHVVLPSAPVNPVRSTVLAEHHGPGPV